MTVFNKRNIFFCLLGLSFSSKAMFIRKKSPSPVKLEERKVSKEMLKKMPSATLEELEERQRQKQKIKTEQKERRQQFMGYLNEIIQDDYFKEKSNSEEESTDVFQSCQKDFSPSKDTESPSPLDLTPEEQKDLRKSLTPTTSFYGSRQIQMASSIEADSPIGIPSPETNHSPHISMEKKTPHMDMVDQEETRWVLQSYKMVRKDIDDSKTDRGPLVEKLISPPESKESLKRDYRKDFAHLFDIKFTFSPVNKFLSKNPEAQWHDVSYEENDRKEKIIEGKTSEKEKECRPFSTGSKKCKKIAPGKFLCSLQGIDETDTAIINKIFHGKIYTIYGIHDLNVLSMNEFQKRFYVHWEKNLIYITFNEYISDIQQIKDCRDFFTYMSDDEEDLWTPHIETTEKPFAILRIPNMSFMQKFMSSFSIFGHMTIDGQEIYNSGNYYHIMLQDKQSIIKGLLKLSKYVLKDWFEKKDFHNINHFLCFGIINKNYIMFPTNEGPKYKRAPYHLEDKHYLAISCFRQLLKHVSFRDFFFQRENGLLSLIAKDFGDRSGLYIEFRKLVEKHLKNKGLLWKLTNKVSTMISSLNTPKKSESTAFFITPIEGAIMNASLKYLFQSSVSVCKIYKVMKKIEKIYNHIRDIRKMPIMAETTDIGTKERVDEEERAEKELTEFLMNRDIAMDYEEFIMKEKEKIMGIKYRDSVLLVGGAF